MHEYSNLLKANTNFVIYAAVLGERQDDMHLAAVVDGDEESILFVQILSSCTTSSM